MPSHLARFTDRRVGSSYNAVIDELASAIEKGDGGYADWVIVSNHCPEST